MRKFLLPAISSLCVLALLATNSQAQLKGNELVKISVVDAQGKVVMQPVMRNLKAGKQLFDINTSSLSNGLYFVQLTVDEHSSQLKLVVVH